MDEFLKDDPARLARILAHLKAPLKDAAAVNATRWALNARLKALGLPVECGGGGLTKYNRVRRGLPKTHWLDAACIGRSTPEHLNVKGVMPLQIMATGHGSRQMCNVDRFGFPCSKPKGAKWVQGFQTGDLVRAVVTSGTKAGIYVGKVAVRTRGIFNITTGHGRVTDIHHRFCTLIARSDGYTYQQRREAARLYLLFLLSLVADSYSNLRPSAVEHGILTRTILSCSDGPIDGHVATQVGGWPTLPLRSP